MSERVNAGALSIAAVLAEFVETEALPGTGLDPTTFWTGFGSLVEEFMPINRALLAERERLQQAIDQWHRRNRDTPFDVIAYQQFLTEIGYLVPAPDDFCIETGDVDPEVRDVAGPQLVVPVLNARFALNAVNARWGSLYDALYGTDALGDLPAAGASYSPERGARVIAAANAFRDEIFPLAAGSHAEATGFAVRDDGQLEIVLVNGSRTGLKLPTQFRGFTGHPNDVSAVLLRNHGLHVELRIDRSGNIGAKDPAGVQDVVVESALTTIVDLEDSVAAVNPADKVRAYRNWLGLNRRTLSESVTKNGLTFERRLAEDRTYQGHDEPFVLPGRSLMFVRNVGHLMTTTAVLDREGEPIGEGLLDALVTALCAIPTKPEGTAASVDRANRPIYIVKPKMHSPAEVAFTVELFTRVEKLLGLGKNTIKLGLMDEERRLSVNLSAAIWEARERIVFVNTGFLDRSGDEIHTSMLAGPTVRKADMRSQKWIKAYEDQNVDVALAAGFRGRGQIGKGMWAMPDLMADMIQKKVEHPLAGATTAWVPSPTAATLHALHYHRVNVDQRQQELSGQTRTALSDLLQIPHGDPTEWTPAQRREEVDNNVQSILGYVVRWIDQGIGCSKVPDLHGVALMEDRATLRISSQLLANWLAHRVVAPDEVENSLLRMARVVDEQNLSDPAHRPMAADPVNNVAFQTAHELIFEGAKQPGGYTELILHRRRTERLGEDRETAAPQ